MPSQRVRHSGAVRLAQQAHTHPPHSQGLQLGQLAQRGGNGAQGVDVLRTAACRHTEHVRGRGVGGLKGVWSAAG
eukprot:352557-Chlamydomonas_euryale.AAC.2